MSVRDFSRKKFRGGAIESFENRGGQNFNYIKSILSLKDNSGGQNHFEGGKMPPLHPPRIILDVCRKFLTLVNSSSQTLYSCSG